MTLKDIAAIAGKPGLYKILKPTRSGMIVQGLEPGGKKFVVNTTHRVSVLEEISMYVTGEEESVQLKDVLLKVHEDHPEQLQIDVKNEQELRAFLEEVLPEYDREKVYPSDAKKLVQWYNLMLAEIPEIFEDLKKEQQEAAAENTEEADKAAEETTDKSKKAPENKTNEEGSAPGKAK